MTRAFVCWVCVKKLNSQRGSGLFKLPLSLKLLAFFPVSIRTQRQQFRLPRVSAVDRPVVWFVLLGAGRHGCELPGAVLHTLHRGRLLCAYQLHLHLWRIQEDDKAGPPQPHQPGVWSQPHHSVRLPLRTGCVSRSLSVQTSRLPWSPWYWLMLLNLSWCRTCVLFACLRWK